MNEIFCWPGSVLVLAGVRRNPFFEVFRCTGRPALGGPGFFGGVLSRSCLELRVVTKGCRRAFGRSIRSLGSRGRRSPHLLPGCNGCDWPGNYFSESGFGPWQLTAIIIVPLTLMSAASAATSLYSPGEKRAGFSNPKEIASSTDAGLNEGSVAPELAFLEDAIAHSLGTIVVSDRLWRKS